MLIKTDGGSRLNKPGAPAAWAFVVYNEQGQQVHSEGGFMAGTCSEAEYEALIMALHYIVEHPESDFDIRCDSKLVVEQTMGRWKIKEPRMKPLNGRVKTLWAMARPNSIKHIPREKNQDADAICRRIMDEHTNDQPDGFFSK